MPVVVALVTLVLAACGADRPDAAGGDPGFGGPSSSAGEPCSTEGAFESCHERLATHGNVVTCIDGQRFCFGGKWSECRQSADTAPRDVRLQPVAAGSVAPLTAAPGGTSCAANPCDPNCQDSTVTGPFTADAGSAPIVVGVSGGYVANSNLPGNCSSTNGGATAYNCSGFKAKTTDPDGVCSECDQYNVPKNGTVTLQQCESACQNDQHCTGDGTDSCTAFSAGQKDWCTGVDVTVPVGCLNSSNQETISVCNRGTADLTQPVDCCQFSGNSAHFADELTNGSACAGGTYLGSTVGTIKAGYCQTMVINPGGNTSSIICNPHYTGPSTTSTPTNYPSTPTADTGGWTSLTNLAATDSANASALLGRQTVTKTFTASTNGTPGWSNTANAAATATDTSYMTAAVTVPAGTVTAYKLPTSNAAVTTSGWTNPTNAYAIDTTTTTGAAVSTTIYASTVSSANSGAGAGAVSWANTANATGAPTEAVGTAASGTAEAYDWPGKNASSDITLDFGTAIPSSIGSMTVTARVADKAAASPCTVKMELVDNTGATIAGMSTLYNSTIGSTTYVDKAYTLIAADLTALTGAAGATFRSDPRIKITISSPNGNPPENRVYVDSVKIVYTYLPVHSFGTFSFGVPAGATVTQIDWQAAVKNAAGAAGSTITTQGYTGSTPVGTAKTFTWGTNLSAVLTTYNWSDTSLALTDTQLADGTFTVRVASTGAGTPEIDYIEARVTYVSGATNTIRLQTFDFSSIPTTATITNVQVNTNWKTSAATGTLGIQSWANLGAGIVALGSETTASGSTTAANATQSYTGAITPAQLSTLEVRVRASGTSANFTASVDYVSVTVTYQITSASVTLGNFGFSIPSGATINSVTLSLKEKLSAAGSAAFQAEAFRAGGTTTGAVASDAAPSTSYATKTGTGSSLGSPADYANGQFYVTLTATSPLATATSFNALVDAVTVTISYTVPGTSYGVAECDEYNNWVAYKKGNSCTNMTVGGAYSAVTYTYDYTPTCAKNGSKIQWNYLVYDGVTPSAGGSTSTIKFEVQTTPPASGFTTVAYTGAPQNSPSVCPLTGVSGCPIDLYTALGANANQPKLTLQITLTPSCDTTASPCTGTVAPTLNSFDVYYSCIDSE